MSIEGYTVLQSLTPINMWSLNSGRLKKTRVITISLSVFKRNKYKYKIKELGNKLLLLMELGNKLLLTEEDSRILFSSNLLQL